MESFAKGRKIDREVGTPHPKIKGLVWTEYRPGEFDWRKGNNRQHTNQINSEKQNEELVQNENKLNPYKTKRPADGVEFKVPKMLKLQDKNGNVISKTKEQLVNSYSNTDKLPDASLLRILNNPNNNKYIRQIAYEEAINRNIDESKIDVSGTLENAWENEREKKEELSSKKYGETSLESLESYDDSILGDFDPDDFLDKYFEGGEDTGWKDPNNPIIRKEFNNLQSLSSRRKYDAMIDYLKRKDPLYDSPEETMKSLKRVYVDFMSTKGGSSILVAAGGAGAGKSTGLLRTAKILGMTKYDPTKHTAGEDTYDFVILDNDIEDDKSLMEVLSKHNGKIIVFDDKDKALVSNANKILSTMKAIGDTNPELRVFQNPNSKEPELFTGKLVFLTNKSLDTLNNDEDHKAIMSRARVEDIRFTINENLELLKDRYKTMGGRQDGLSEDEEKKVREELYNMIISNKKLLDPSRFTVRHFDKMLQAARTELNSNKVDSENAKKVLGEGNYRKKAMKEMLKGMFY